MSTELDRINKSVWSRERTRRIFARREGWTDAGEAFVMRRIAEEARGGSILDIGVGAGRTLPYLHSLAGNYVAVDYLDEMVRLTRSRFPFAQIEWGDAQSLDAFADSTFDVVVFSFNGIDGLAHGDRPRVFGAVRRVLRERGLFAYSSHNLDHRCAGLAPWHPIRFRLGDGPRSLASSIRSLPKSIPAYRRLRSRTVTGDGWASLVDPAYDFGVVWHYVSLEEGLNELRRSGYSSDIEAYTTEGVQIEPTEDTSTSPWIHYLARTKPGP